MAKKSLKNSDKRMKNLKPWRPGQSGNPKGRPKKNICLTSLLKEEIYKINPQDKRKRTWAELIVLATMKLAIKGNSTALREIWERIGGKIDNWDIEQTNPIVIVNGKKGIKGWPKPRRSAIQ